MKEIIALQEYTDKFVSLYEGEIRNIEQGLANKLIEQGIVAEHDENSSDVGYKYTEKINLLTEETITLDLEGQRKQLLYPDKITEDEIIVTFDGQKYVCKKHSVQDGNVYGDTTDTFSEYPFKIVSSLTMNSNIISSTTGEHTIKIEVKNKQMEVSNDFKEAVKISSEDIENKDFFIAHITYDYETNNATMQEDFQDLVQAYSNNKILIASILKAGNYPTVTNILLSSNSTNGFSGMVSRMQQGLNNTYLLTQDSIFINYNGLGHYAEIQYKYETFNLASANNN